MTVAGEDTLLGGYSCISKIVCYGGDIIEVGKVLTSSSLAPIFQVSGKENVTRHEVT